MTPYILRKSVRGFTLVELLVVIGIIGILLALGLPAYRSAIAHANIAKCSSNLRQIGVGMITFAGDNNGNLPESGGWIPYNTLDSVTGLSSWTQQLETYVGTDKSIFTCPDSSKTIPQNVPYSYFNGAHAAFAQSGGNYAAVKLSNIRNASVMIMGGDIAFSGNLSITDSDKDDYTQDPAFNGGTKNNPITIPIHLGSSNILFVDGHVESLKYFDPTVNTTVYDGPGVNYSYLYMK